MSNPNLKECRPCRTEKLSTHWKRFSKGKAGRGRKFGMPKLKPPVAVVLGPGPLGRWISLSRANWKRASLMSVGRMTELRRKYKLSVRTLSKPLSVSALKLMSGVRMPLTEGPWGKLEETEKLWLGVMTQSSLPRATSFSACRFTTVRSEKKNSQVACSFGTVKMLQPPTGILGGGGEPGQRPGITFVLPGHSPMKSRVLKLTT